jgi:predicted phosphodiesterase
MANEFVLIADVHGNAPALQEVVDAEGSDKEYMVLGDIHGLLAYPSETLELVQEVGNFVLAGNHDKAMFHYGEGHVNNSALSKFELHHTTSNLTDEQHEWMEKLPFLEVVQRGDSRICLTHAMPWPEQASGYEAGNAGVQKKNVASVASAVSNDYDYVFHGHTHEQYELDCSQWGHDVHFVNPGTLGYNGEYAVVDTDHGGVSLKEVEYDEDAVKKHVQSHLPEGAPHTENWL